MQSQL